MTDISAKMADKMVEQKQDEIENNMTTKMTASLELPCEVVQASSGFSLDIGDVTAKLVYRDINYFTNGKPRNKHQVKSGKVAVKLVSFACGDTDAIVTYINQHCDVTPCEHGDNYIFVTSTTEDKGKEIREKLNCPTKFLNKIACYVAGMHYLVKHASGKKVFHQVPEEGIQEGEGLAALYKGFRGIIESTGLGSLHMKEKLDMPNITKHFPLILAICDSEFSYIHVEEDGQFRLLDSCSYAGQPFLALTKYFTGITDPDEINALVEGSSGQTVDSYAEELVKPGLDDDPYSKLQIRSRLFPFGKVLSQSEDVELGDVIHSLLQTICELGAQVGYHISQSQNIPVIYYCGDLMEMAKTHRFTAGMMHLCQYIMKSHVDYQFLKHGNFLAAIGAFIEPYIQQQE